MKSSYLHFVRVCCGWSLKLAQKKDTCQTLKKCLCYLVYLWSSNVKKREALYQKVTLMSTSLDREVWLKNITHSLLVKSRFCYRSGFLDGNTNTCSFLAGSYIFFSIYAVLPPELTLDELDRKGKIKWKSSCVYALRVIVKGMESSIKFRPWKKPQQMRKLCAALIRTKMD